MAKQSSIGYREILSELQMKSYKPVYFLSGEEPYFIDLIADYILNNVLAESEREFNQYVYYGKDVQLKTVLENARRFPMMAQYQVIVVKEAQNIASFDDLANYVQHPQPSTILVFCYKKKADARKKFVTEVAKNGVFFNSDKLYDNQIPSFIQNYMMGKSVQIDEKSTQLLADYIGTDLHRLVNELDKLIMTKPSTAKMITTDLVEKNVGISKEFNDFELKTALIQKDVYKSNMIAFHLSQSKSFALNVTISVLYAYFSNLMVYYYIQDKNKMNVAKELGISSYFADEYALGARNYNAWKTMSIISLLREYDAKSKGVGNNTTSNSGAELLKELVFKILH
ncbi:MAG: DNA polymerase III subunit delta [Paludibacteraceae bacterium]|nr:DNA polymerase III subunit delta [Paludibacteraceae bacterium]MBR5972574.1 DNA polymerase III subunit delta [Paludibacteraceae bacterium]